MLSRESWMTELPPELQHIGLGARTFKKRSGPEKKDRSIWTDTPADRERKARVGILYCFHVNCCLCVIWFDLRVFLLHQQERLEGKKTGEAKDDSVPQLSRRDMEMAEKVSKYNVSSFSFILLNVL